MRRFARLTAWIRSLFEPNPVFRREMRARWRRMAAFLTLFFYAAPLALAMTLLYADKAGRSVQEEEPVVISSNRVISRKFFAVVVQAPGSSAPTAGASALQGMTVDTFGPQLSTIGRQLFESLILLQVVAWLLIAPATAAPMLAAERERGLLEALQLANLPARRVVLGKYLAV